MTWRYGRCQTAARRGEVQAHYQGEGRVGRRAKRAFLLSRNSLKTDHSSAIAKQISVPPPLYFHSGAVRPRQYRRDTPLPFFLHLGYPLSSRPWCRHAQLLPRRQRIPRSRAPAGPKSKRTLAVASRGECPRPWCRRRSTTTRNPGPPRPGSPRGASLRW